MNHNTEDFKDSVQRVVMNNMCCGNCNLLLSGNCKMRMADYMSAKIMGTAKKNIKRFIDFDKTKISSIFTNIFKKVTTKAQRNKIMEKLNVMKPIKIHKEHGRRSTDVKGTIQ